jgi:hypothetical protein
MMFYNNTWLIKRIDAGDRVKFLFFWGHQPARDGTVGRNCFSQWWPAPFDADGITYPTAEHWMMAKKARLFGDRETEDKILQANTPAEAKKFGRLVKNFDLDVWDRHKFEIVVQGNFHKFSSHPELKKFLTGTQDRVLAEASPVDIVWGIGLAADHTDIENPLKWRGENLLGYALMQVRDQLTSNS